MKDIEDRAALDADGRKLQRYVNMHGMFEKYKNQVYEQLDPSINKDINSWKLYENNQTVNAHGMMEWNQILFICLSKIRSKKIPHFAWSSTRRIRVLLLPMDRLPKRLNQKWKLLQEMSRRRLQPLKGKTLKTSGMRM